MPYVRAKELPKVGFLGHVRDLLYREKLWEIEVVFAESIERLGASFDDRVRKDVQAFNNDGLLGGWTGSYGGSSAMMFSDSKSAKAAGGKLNTNLPENVAVVEITRHWKKSWVKMTLNPAHQAALLPEAPSGVDMDRAKKILDVFVGLKAAYRQDPLHELKVTTEEFEMLVEKGWLKPHKGKSPHKYDKPIYKGKYPEMYRYYDLAGCKITTEGKNICRG